MMSSLRYECSMFTQTASRSAMSVSTWPGSNMEIVIVEFKGVPCTSGMYAAESMAVGDGELHVVGVTTAVRSTDVPAQTSWPWVVPAKVGVVLTTTSSSIVLMLIHPWSSVTVSCTA